MSNKQTTVSSTVDMAGIQEAVTSAFVDLFPVISTGEWVKWNPDDQVSLRETLRLMVETGNGILRPTFDATVWAGHVDGTVDNSIESIRAQRKESEKSGEKKAPDALSVLNARLGIKPVETTS